VQTIIIASKLKKLKEAPVFCMIEIVKSKKGGCFYETKMTTK
jgi:hypothetical protein